jgi:hypothetical protein
MTVCTKQLLLFPSCKSRKIQADFRGGDITSDGGGILLRQADRRLELTAQLSRCLSDPRRTKSCTHGQIDFLRQRIYGLALGYEDLNDHETLRKDPAFQTFVERDGPLAHPSTLCRFENRAERETAVAMNRLMVEKFIESFKKPPTELVLDFDATDDVVHGQQEGRFFHGYYDHYCFLPLYVFCGSQLLVSYLRPSKIDPAKHAWAILALLVKRLRQQWPEVRIVFRADSGFCRWRMLRWCESKNVHYIVGLAKNSRINAVAEPCLEKARQRFERTQRKQRIFTSVRYAALSWDRQRRVLVKAEHSAMGSNPRYVVTNLKGSARSLYEKTYCGRGDMENRVKEQQLDMFSDRTSCHHWWANQFRLLLSSLAYVLVDTLRRLGLRGTELAKAQCQTIRLKLFKIGGLVIRNTRRIRLHFSSAYPYQHIFHLVAHRLARE